MTLAVLGTGYEVKDDVRVMDCLVCQGASHTADRQIDVFDEAAVRSTDTRYGICLLRLMKRRDWVFIKDSSRIHQGFRWEYPADH